MIYSLAISRRVLAPVVSSTGISHDRCDSTTTGASRPAADERTGAGMTNGWPRKRVSEIAKPSLGKMLDRAKN